jgi:hypothetical protein
MINYHEDVLTYAEVQEMMFWAMEIAKAYKNLKSK